MLPTEPGLGETEESMAGASEQDTAVPQDSQASHPADEQPTPAVATETTVPSEAVTLADAPAPADEMPTSGEVVSEDATAPADTAITSDTPAPDSAAVSDASASDAAAASDAPASDPRIKRGELIDVTVIESSPTQVIVETPVEGKRGVITTRELERLPPAVIETLTVGANFKAFVVNVNDNEGRVVLSVTRAQEELDWQMTEEYRKSQATYESVISGYNRGGLIVRFGRLRGFVPQSQLSADRRITGKTPDENYGSMVNQPIVVKVMEVDRARNRLILSERAATRESREKRKQALIEELTVGDIREGHVVSLEDFGAFVDIGGAEGLVHITEITWKHITHPRDFLKIGQQVRVEVISIDAQNKRIGLSMRRQEADPWDTVAINYQVGQLVQGSITKLTKFGAFARLVDLPEIEGLVHISELSEQRVNHPREVVQEGDKLTLRIVKVEIKERRLGLSLKKVNSAEYLDMDWGS